MNSNINLKDFTLRKAPKDTKISFITLLAYKEMNSFLENAFNGPFDWEKWEFELRDAIQIQNSNKNKNKSIDYIHLIALDKIEIGFLWVSKQSEEIFWIDSFIIDSTYQNKGYGKKVFYMLLELIKNLGNHINFIDLGVQFQNTRALQFYKNLGFFEVTDISMSYYKTQRMRYNI